MFQRVLLCMSAALASMAQANFKRCGTNPTRENVIAIENLYNKAIMGKSVVGYNPLTRKPPTIKVYFHVLMDNSGIGNLTNNNINEQMAQLNQDFGGRYTFALQSVDRTVNPTWFYKIDYDTKTNIIKMKRALYKGSFADLNVYTLDMQLLGFATLPHERRLSFLDGVVINYRTLPGGSQIYYNMGKTLSHEVGRKFYKLMFSHM
jgi:hypothetical protein